MAGGLDAKRLRAQWAEIDRLRREVKVAFELLDENEQKNRELIKQLPQPTAKVVKKN